MSSVISSVDADNSSVVVSSKEAPPIVVLSVIEDVESTDEDGHKMIDKSDDPEDYDKKLREIQEKYKKALKVLRKG